MIELEDRLRELGDRLDIDGDDASLVDDVMARLDAVDNAGDDNVDDAIDGPRTWIVPLRVAAAVVVLLVAVAAAVPSSRRTVAGWFGFDGATIERDVQLEAPDEPDPLDGRGTGTTLATDGQEILVAAFEGTLENPGLGKVIGSESDVTEVSVDGAYALWIDGAPHQVSFFDPSGEIVFSGFAGNTLLWQDGELIRRLEGFDTADAAIAYAESLD